MAAPRPSDPISGLCWSGFIDLIVANDSSGVAVIVENKIRAELNNPLESYTRHATDAGYPTVLLAVLAPDSVTLDPHQARWISGTVRYQALIDLLGEQVKQAAADGGPRSRDVQRSLDLLQQFRETRERGSPTMDYSSDARYLHEFRSNLVGREAEVSAFFDAVKAANALVRERSKRLESPIRERLNRLGWATVWEEHGSNNTRWVNAWNAYTFAPSNVSVELIMSPDPARANLITVKAYPGRTYKVYPDYNHIPIGVNWESADAEIADAFLEAVKRATETHSTGTASPE